MSLREELSSFLKTLDIALPDDFDDDTALVSSGMLDSSALFNLVLWVESKIGAAIDPSSIDIGQAWDTQRRIIAFIETRQVGSDLPISARHVSRSTVRVVAFSAQHEDAVVQLAQQGLWSASVETNRRYLDWKHVQNPYGRGRIYLAFDADELVAMRSFYPARWELGQPSRFEDLLVADDLVVRKSHRNRGVVTELMQAALEDLHQQGVEYLFNLSGGRVTVLSSLAMGWRSVGHLHPVGRLSSGRALRNTVRSLITRLPIVWRYRASSFLYTTRELHPFTGLSGRSYYVSKTGVTVEISSEPRVDEMAALILKLPCDGRFRHVRDAAYMAWRYRNPLNEYCFFYAGAGALHGYLVVKWKSCGFGPDGRVEVVDWEADDEHYLDALLEAALSAGAFPELVTWRATRDDNVGTALVRSGFEVVDRHLATYGCPCILVRSLNSSRPPSEWLLNEKPLLDLRSWDMRMIYSMAG